MEEHSRSTLRASPGDRLVIHGHHLGEPERDGEILKVIGEDGSPPFVVRWSDDGHVSEVFPGSDASVEQFPGTGPSDRAPDAAQRPDR